MEFNIQQEVGPLLESGLGHPLAAWAAGEADMAADHAICAVLCAAVGGEALSTRAPAGDSENRSELLKIEAGSSLRKLGERCRIRVIDDADHVFSQSGPRATLQDILSEELFARTTSGGPPAVATKVEKELLG